MELLRFTLGTLGIIFIISALSSFIGGMVTGIIALNLGFQIFLIILGTAMAYFGFYYIKSTHEANHQLIRIAKWGIAYTIAIFLSNYIINRLVIANPFFAILFTTTIISIISQVIRSHESSEYNFKKKWFIFYFLVYANIIWVMEEFILPNLVSKTGIFSYIIIGFTIAGIVAIIQKINIKGHSVNWITFILIILLLVANLEFLPLSANEIFIGPALNASGLSEDKQLCPTIISKIPVKTEAQLNSGISSTINYLIDTSIWKIEKNIEPCYKGKYKGQYPNWFYCDNMVVSRWETSSSGTIRYRWYTALTANWQPTNGKYTLNSLSCENGKKVVVDKIGPEFYTYDSKDGTVVKINVFRDETKTEIKY